MDRFEIRIDSADAAKLDTPLLALPLFQDADLAADAAAVDAALDGAVARVRERGDFRARPDESLLLYAAGVEGPQRVVLIGLGKREALDRERVRRALGTAVRQAEKLGSDAVALATDAVVDVGELSAQDVGCAAAEGAVLAAWDYRELKTVEDEDAPRSRVVSLTLTGAADADALQEGARVGRIVAESENLARELAARPGNIATPSHLASVAGDIATEHGLSITVLDRAKMQDEGMGALLAVAQGSEEEPRLIVLEYQGGPDGDAPLALVGKGVTFDAGGISIKPALKMEEMKYDMGGAAAVLGAMRAIAALDLPVNVVGVVPSTENLPSGKAVKPGDVVRSHSGKTIEIINTDAEGRLILADALSYVQRYHPRAILDAATLTGAVIIGLGHHAIGLMGTDDALVDEVRSAGERTGERCWPLPLWDDYRRQLDSAVADIQNTGGRPAGTITAGWFLREFAGDAPWAHLDVAGTAWKDDALSYLRKGPTGIPTRLFVEWVKARAES
ncbi:MAG: leucyl aminopeptidase [Gemmatimonadota bacterium]|jgi:leucyl aminopeptidase